MKRWLVHTLLLLALFGHLGHSFHNHHHSEAGESCPICVVDDLSKVTTEHYTFISSESVGYAVNAIYQQILTRRTTPFYRNRAPPLS